MQLNTKNTKNKSAPFLGSGSSTEASSMSAITQSALSNQTPVFVSTGQVRRCFVLNDLLD